MSGLSRAHWPTAESFVFAHRGLNRQAPENTMPAFIAAADAGVKWFETDIDILPDGTLVVLHDSTLDRTTNRSGSIYGMTGADLDDVDAGSWFSPEFAGTRLPVLADVIDFMNKRRMNANLELKSHETGKDGTLRLIAGVIRELERLEPGREVIISSFSPLVLAEFHRLAPQYSIGQIYAGPLRDAAWRSSLELIGASYVHPEDAHLTRGQVEAFLAEGYGVNVWTVNSKPRANELLNWGCTGIFTDQADALLGTRWA